MSSSVRELRESFLSYFESKEHLRVRSSPLIPHNDPTLLFTNAGMVQFKDYFTGAEKPDNKRATSVQKCVRAGGKHNDLESVGRTKRHHTFFEMLGNFSFGDYFKEEAIQFAWEYLTKVIGVDSSRIWASVFTDDDEAYKLWTDMIGLPKDRVVRMGEEENFWAMGDTGPCGPCSELYIDRGEKFGKSGETIFDGGERFLEVWNLVFMQFEQKTDGTRIQLPKPSVDTGMGLERLASILQNKDNNYEIDGMFRILEAFSEITKVKYGQSEESDVALKVLTDHIRSVCFLISDGVQPGNEGRNYVLRRILRRAIRFGKKLGCEEPFFFKGINTLVDEMGDAYPELVQNKSALAKLIYHEEEKFFETLESGLKLLGSELGGLSSGGTIPGQVAFKLYDTFGFPLDLTAMIAEERGFQVDQKGFEEELEKQRERSRSSWKGSGQETVSEVYHQLSQSGVSTAVRVYESLQEDTKVAALIKDGQVVDEISEGDEAQVVLECSPFYAESGGQVGDRGLIEAQGSKFEVRDVQKPVENFSVAIGKQTKGRLKKEQTVTAVVDKETRNKTRINHTMTHVLHAALQKILGDHIKQAGSLVGPDYLRFDFSHPQQVTREEIKQIEQFCNARIRENPNIKTSVENLEQAIAGGAKAFFEEKYGDEVRVLRVGEFSTELCGGTHAESLAEAGLFKITSESSVASGVRRIVAVTGQKALDFVYEEERMLDEIAATLKTPKRELISRVEKMLKERSELVKKASQRPKASSGIQGKTFEVENIPVLVEIVDTENPKELRPLADEYRNQMKSGLILLGAKVKDKATLVIALTKDLAEHFDTKTLVSKAGESLGGKGGGRSDFAQLGGSNTDFLTEENLKRLATEHIQNLQLSA